MHNHKMDKYVFRRTKLRTLIDLKYGGVNASLANALGIEPSYVSRMLYPDGKAGAKKIGEGMIDKINACHPEWLSESEYTHNQKLMMSTADDILINQFHDAKGSMGSGITLRDQPGEITGWRVSIEWANKNIPANTGKENLCIVTGFGDSMRGMFNSGDPLIVDTGVNDLSFDGVYFFRIGNEGFIKRLQRIPGDGIRAISENKAYESWTIKDDMDFELFGRVIKVWRSEEF